MRKIVFLIGVLISFTFGNGLTLSQLEIGKGYIYLYEDKNYEEAFKIFEKFAKLGYADAQIGLGLIYHQGLGVKQNYKLAKKYWEEAYIKEKDYAAYNLGVIYFEGKEDVKQDYKLAKKYWEEAYSNGNKESSYQLGLMYFEGAGVDKNYKLAKKYWEEVSDQIPMAQNDIGVLYLYGYGVEKDYKKAYELFIDAAEKGNTESLHNLGVIYFEGYGIKKDYKMAFDFFNAASKNGYAQSLHNLGIMYLKGLGVEENHNIARKYLEKSVSKGYEESLKVLDSIDRMNKLFDNFDLKKALELYGKEEYEEAIKIFKTLPDSDVALYYLGICHLTGQGVATNHKEAFFLLDKSSSKGNKNAKNQLALMYYLGIGTKQDIKKAEELYEISCKNGFKKACEIYQEITLENYLKNLGGNKK